MPHWEYGIWNLLFLILNDIDAVCGRVGVSNLDYGRFQGKKIGAETGDPNLRFQPRLPGSVVGEASMGQVGNGDKITEVTVRW
jgi:hypothetical protein